MAQKSKIKREEESRPERKLAECMAQLLQMSAEEQERLFAEQQDGQVSQTWALSKAVLSKAIEKGDVAAFREVKALLGETDGKRSYLEALLGEIQRTLCGEQASQEPKKDGAEAKKAAGKQPEPGKGGAEAKKAAGKQPEPGKDGAEAEKAAGKQQEPE